MVEGKRRERKVNAEVTTRREDGQEGETVTVQDGSRSRLRGDAKETARQTHPAVVPATAKLLRVSSPSVAA